MIEYRLENGKLIKVRPENEQRFLEKHPNATPVSGNQESPAEGAPIGQESAVPNQEASQSQNNTDSNLEVGSLESLGKNVNNSYIKLNGVNTSMKKLKSSMDDAKAFNNEVLYNSLAEEYNNKVDKYKNLDVEYIEAVKLYKTEDDKQVAAGTKVKTKQEEREEGSFISDIFSYIPNSLLPPGVAAAKMAIEGTSSWLGDAVRRGWDQAADTGEAADVILGGKDVSLDTVSEWVKANEDKAKDYKESEKMLRFMKKYEAEGRTWTSFFRNVKEEPSLMAELLIQSYATMAGTAWDSPEALAAAGIGAGVGAGTGAAATFYGFGVGAIPGGIAGGMGGLAVSMETSLTLGEFVKEELELQGEEFTDENVLALMQSDKGKSIRNRAVGRGLAIGAVEALTGSLGGKVTSTVLKTGAKVAAKSAVKGAAVKVGSMAAGVGIEAVGGGLGEVAGRLVAGQEMDKAEIGFEAITGTATAPLNVGYALGTYKKPSYKLNGEITSYDKMKDFIDTATEEDIAKADIDIDNDLSGLDKNAYEKQNKFYTKTQIDPRVSDEKDINSLVDLEIKLQKVNQKSQSGKNRAKAIKEQIKDITDKYSDVDITSEEVIQKRTKRSEVKKARRENMLSSTIKFAEEQGKIIGKETIVAENDAEAQVMHDKAVEEYNAKNPDNKIIPSNVAGADGFIVGDVIIINKDIAGKTGAINVGAHELLHGIMAKQMKELGVEGRTKLMSDFKNIITKEQFNYIEKRIKENYKDQINEDPNWINQTDEWVTIFSDGIKQGDITFNEGVFDKLKNFIQEIARKVGYKKEFENGRQVYNFLKDYQKDVDKGELSKRSINVAGGGTSVTEIAKSKSDDVKPEVDELGNMGWTKDTWKSQGADLAIAEMQANKMLDGLIAAKMKGGLRDGNNETRKDFISKVYSELTAHVKNFNPESNDSLFGWVNSQVSNKAGNVYNREYKDKSLERAVDIDATTSEGAPLVQIEADTDILMQRIDEIGLDETEVEQRSKLRRAIRLDESMMQTVRNAVIKTFGTKLPNVESKKFRAALEKAFRTELKKPLQDLMGGRSEYDLFLRNHIKAIVKALPVGTLVQMERNLKPEQRIFTESRRITKSTEVDKLVSEGKLPKDTSRTSGPQLHTKKTFPGIEKAMAYFRGKDMEAVLGYKVGASTLGTRKDKLATELGVELAFDATSEVLQTPEVQKKRQGILELQNEVQQDNELAVIAKQINRDPNIKFSRKTKDVDAVVKYLRDSAESSPNKVIKSRGILSPLVYKVTKKVSNVRGEVDVKIVDMDREIIVQKVGKNIRDSKELTTISKQVNRILNNLAAINPAYLGLLRSGMANGQGKSMFGLASVFDKIADGAEYVMPGFTKRFAFHKNKRLDKNRVIQDESGEIFFMVGKEKMTGKEFVAYENKKADLLVEFFSDIATLLKDNPQDAWFYSRFVTDASSNGSSIFRTSALLIGMPLDDNGRLIYDQAVVEEHMKPQNNIGTMLLSAAIDAMPNLSVADIGKIMKASFAQISLLEVDDDLVTLAGFKTKMPADYWSKVLPAILNEELSWLGRGMGSIIRYSESGINLNKYFIPSLGKGVSVADHFKVGVDTSNMDGKRLSAIVQKQNELITNILTGEITREQASKQIIAYSKSKPLVGPIEINNRNSAVEAINNRIKYSKSGEAKGMSTFDFDETLIIDGDNSIIATDPVTGQVIEISSSDWPIKGPDLAAAGFEFDFSDFANVRGGKEGPLLQKMKNQIVKYGNKNVFVLTARQQASALPIQQWLKSKGIDLSIENITGLGKSEGSAKGEWMLQKFAEGYNDMYFVDDAMSNVKAVKDVLDVLDIKSKVVQAKIKFSKSASVDFNKMLEKSKGIRADVEVSSAAAKIRGAKKGRFDFFVPPSAEDFKGLIYSFLGKGKQGEADLLWFKDNLFDPFAKGIREMDSIKQAMTEEYKAIKKSFPTTIKGLNEKIAGTDFTLDNAIRVYLWKEAGFEIPGLSEKEANILWSAIKADPTNEAFARALSAISRSVDGYTKPSEFWVAETIASDLSNIVNKVNREQYLSEWIESKNIVFSKENLNKIESIYGTNFREALENILFRMESGSNRPSGQDKVVNRFINWINGSVGAVMFFNTRSAVLQTLSIANFINFKENNIFAAAKGFANQKQFWSDFAMIYNSDMLKQRRAGLKIDVSASELTEAFSKGKSRPEAIIAYLLQIGFTPTQIADSFAISMGGSTYYRNMLNKYMKDGMSKADAEAKAFLDFQEIAEETQQSSRPDMISQQQSGTLGRIILAWANTPMQMTRLTKKALSDLVNGRGDIKSNVSKILYYGMIQNFIFGSLQTGLAFLAFGDEEDEEKTQTKEIRVANGMLDTLLRGTGVYGAAVSTVKNVVLKWSEENSKGYGKRDWSRVVQEIINLSPPIGTKVRKIMSAVKTYAYNKDVIKKMGPGINNPGWSVFGNVVEAVTNAPVARVINKANNVKQILTGNMDMWQRAAILLGWSTWSVSVEDQELVDAKAEVKADRKAASKERSKQKKTDSKKSKTNIKTVRCSGTRSSGGRCNIQVETNAKSAKCMYHKEFKEGSDTDGDGKKEYRCKSKTGSGKRCRNKTENKNKRCYAHQ